MASIIYSHVAETLTYSTECIACRVAIVVKDVPAGAFGDWKSGRLPINEALSMLTPGQREAMITNFCEPCFDALSKERDEKESQK